MIEIAPVGMDNANLYVNVFDGGPRTRVLCDMNGDRRELKRMHLADPSTQSLYAAAGESLKYWVRAEASSHLWFLEAPTHTVNDWRNASLIIVDEYGRSTATTLSIPSQERCIWEPVASSSCSASISPDQTYRGVPNCD